jgi:DNA-binding response OmpR family regulator
MRILIIEKDSKGAAAIKKGLEDFNFWVDIVSEKNKVISMAQDSGVDLILFSSSPQNSGEMEILNALLEKELNIPFLFFPGEPAESRETGDKITIPSPEHIFDLIGRFQRALQTGESNRGAKIQFGPLELDPVSHKVWRDQKEINLTPKEYTLLEFFIRHPNQILTRTMIANHVWNQNFDFFTNVIDVYINYLRRKLDQGHKTKLIHTVRGKGYILKEG